jgi:hypothetical protein
LQGPLLYVIIHLFRPIVQSTRIKEGNGNNTPPHRRQPIAQAGVAEWLERVSGEVGQAVDRKVDAKQPVCCDVLELGRYAQSAKGLSSLSLTVRHRHPPRSFRMRRLHRSPKH